MGYTTHPTASDRPMEELSPEEVTYETMVRVLFEAFNNVYNPFADERERTLGSMIIVVISDLAENYDQVFEHAQDYARFQAERMAERQGVTLDELLASAEELPGDFEALLKDLDTSFDA